jgi:hypothetical protein
MRKLRVLIACVSWFAVLNLPATSHAACWVDSDHYYTGSFQQSHDCSGTEVILIDPMLTNFTSCEALPAELEATGDYEYECDMAATLDIGGALVNFHGPADVILRFTLIEKTEWEWTWDTELVYLWAQGNEPRPYGCTIRASSAPASTGQLRWAPPFPWWWAGSLDIFTDISLDQGRHWGSSGTPGPMTTKCIMCAVPTKAGTWGNLKASYH